MTKFLLTIAELGLIPDAFIKIAVRFITTKRLNDSDIYENKPNIIKSISEGGIAEKTDDANEQHYEVPPAFFKYALGKNLKYSCSFPFTMFTDRLFAKSVLHFCIFLKLY